MSKNQEYPPISELISQNDFILMEASVNERLRRTSDIQLHPELVGALLVYSKNGRKALADIFNEYIDIATRSKLPIFLCTPTRTANQVNASKYVRSINKDNVQFLQQIRNKQPDSDIRIGGMIGCKNDCYLPVEALSADEGEHFHRWQIRQLEEAGIDFLIVETIPSVEEAMGIAREMAKTSLPYFISFVIGKDGNILDGNSLANAIQTIDETVSPSPTAYMVNCAFPTFLQIQQVEKSNRRLLGYLANGSSLDHSELEGATCLHQDNLEEWGNEMLKLNTAGIKILGGCCGTGPEHLQYLVDNS